MTTEEARRLARALTGKRVALVEVFTGSVGDDTVIITADDGSRATLKGTSERPEMASGKITVDVNVDAMDGVA